MKKYSINIILIIFFCQLSSIARAQEDEGNDNDSALSNDIKVPGDDLQPIKTKLLDSLTYQTASGLPIAASKIYFSDKKFTISGFAESSFSHYEGAKNRSSGDLELYQTNLQRFVTYAAYKPVDWMIIYAEIFAEYVNDGTQEGELEYLPEVFLDFLIDPAFNLRVGTHQPQIGYINNNDEPIMFYTVNRPEVERLIIPSQWIDLGIMSYGNITKDLKWSFSAYQGLEANNLNGATWLRGGREDALRFNLNNLLFNSSLTYTGLKDWEFGLNGVYSDIKSSQKIETSSGGERDINSSTYLLSSYARFEFNNWTLMGLASYGHMSGTEDIYRITQDDTGNNGEILGENVYGFYAEIGYDILPALGWNKRDSKSDNVFIKSHEMKLPLFFRYERLNTHASLSSHFEGMNVFQSDLNAYTFGINFNPRRSIVLKANYQFRDNSQPLLDGGYEGNRFEIGIGFIF